MANHTHLTDEQQCAVINAVPIADLGDLFVAALPQEATMPIHGTGCSYIKPEYAPAIAEALHGFIAHVIASLLNAGSERDAVMENEELAAAIEAELLGWGGEPQ